MTITRTLAPASARQSLLAPTFFFAAWVGVFGWMILRIG